MDAAIRKNTPPLHEGLEALLMEVNGLANRLKATDPRVAIPSASRAALQVLQRCGPQTVPQIARARFSSRQNIQILINRLKDEGLVELIPNPDHKRSALVRLTNRGQDAIAHATQEEARLSNDLLPAFSPSELSVATDVLNKLRKLLESQEQGTPSREQPSRSAHFGRDVHESAARVEIAQHANPSPIESSDLPDEGELPVNLL